jgi:hypothetical protein
LREEQKTADERLREEQKTADERLREEQKTNEPGRCMSGPGSL